MRFLIHEMGFERLLAAGQLRYVQREQPSGATEAWRLTQAAAGYRFLRVDVDCRSVNGENYLFHLTLRDGGDPERLNFRFWRPGLKISGNVLFQPEGAIVHRVVNDQRFQETVDTPLPFWFPSAVGLAQLVPLVGAGAPATEVLTLDPDRALAFHQALMVVEAGAQEELVVARHVLRSRPYSIRWREQDRVVWLDDDGLPLRVAFPDGLNATETRYIRYFQRQQEA